MEIGSKVGIYKISKVEPKNAEPFYNATVFEKVYNSKNPINKWETAFYEAYIFDTSLELEPADFSLNNNEKDKFSFDNISNPDKSIVRVLKFKFENHTIWYGREQQKDNYGRPKIKPVFYLFEIEPNKSNWVNEENRLKKMQAKIDAITMAMKKKEDEHRVKILEMKKKIGSLEREIQRYKQIVEKHKDEIAEGKNRLKEAHYETMVYKRKTTITNNTLEKTQKQLEETNKDLRRVKKMKKDEVIQKANEFIDNNFDFGEI